MHRLLLRQWRRHFGDTFTPPPEWQGFLDAVDAAYQESDVDRAMLERSLELNSQELLQGNAEMRAVLRAFPDLIIRINASGEILEFKSGVTHQLGVPAREAIGRRIQDVMPANEPNDPLGQAIRRAAAIRSLVHAEYSLTRGAETCFYEARVVPMPGDQLIAIVRDITNRKRSERFRREQNEIFERIASGTPLVEQLTRLASVIESQVDGSRCVVMLADAAGARMMLAAAPSMPPEFSEAVAGGVPIGEGLGSCATAVHRKTLVIARDTLVDPLWFDLREHAQRFGIRACCSIPIMSHNDRAVGSFAMYFAAPHEPDDEELHMLNLASHIAAVAVQRKHSEEDLFRSRQMLRMVLDTIPLRVFWKDRNSVFVGCNKALADVRGYRDPAEIAGATDDEHVDAEAAERYRADDREVMESNRPKLNYEELQVDRFTGAARWLRTSKIPLHDQDGNVIGVLGTSEDITDSKEREETLRRVEEKYRNIVENAVEGMFQSSPEGTLLDANPAFARMLGFGSAAELIGESADMRHRLFVQAARHEEFVATLQRSGVVQRFEAEMRRRDGRTVWVSLHARLERDADGNALRHEGFAEDITSLKQLEAQFRQVQKMEAFGQLAGGVAHDFNNILTAIRVSVSMLKDKGFSAEDRAAAIPETLRAVDRAANLTRQLLTFSRRQPLEAVPIDLNEVVAGMTKMFQRVIGEHIRLETHYAAGGAHIRADAGMMEQALMNLAVNSRDAMPEGGTLVLRTAIETIVGSAGDAPAAGRRPGTYVRLTVTDTGIGIRPEHLPHIFEPFFTTKPVGRGTGLGLATVFGIVEQHHGWIEVDSKPGSGATFHLFFPRISVPRALLEETKRELPVPYGCETILLAEDEADVRSVVSSTLKRYGYRVLAARSGVAALELWRRRGPEIDLLLTDVIMPDGMTGSELARRLTSDRPELKVIFCSGYTDQVLGKDSPLRRNVNFVEKPFDVGDLLRLIRRSLDETPRTPHVG